MAKIQKFIQQQTFQVSKVSFFFFQLNRFVMKRGTPPLPAVYTLLKLTMPTEHSAHNQIQLFILFTGFCQSNNIYFGISINCNYFLN